VFDSGAGPPVIVIPGVQGRWEWMRPPLEALSRRCRVISYSLCGDIGSGFRMDPDLGFDSYLHQLDAILDRAHVGRATLCGVSYGGMIAVRYAAMHPDRVSGVVIVSSPSPGWKPTARQNTYVARPWLSMPAFVASAATRLWPEVRSALPEWRSRLAFGTKHAARVLLAPAIPSLMALRVRQQEKIDLYADCARVHAPTLVITGDEALDAVVPVQVTHRYCELIPAARYVKMAGTGHIGLITQPERFAELVGGFAHANHH
jgi:3-oxoadipate enol-lactonase